MRCVVLLLAGCGRIGFGATEPTDAPATALAITAPTTILPLTAERLTANLPVVWSGDGVDADGTFHAPATTGPAVVHATADGVTVDALITVTTNASPQVATTTALANASGMAQQTHLLWAAERGEWWLFTQAGSAIATMHSADFASWSAGPSVDLGHPSDDGRNLTLADAVLGGTHVVHLSAGWNDSNTRGRSHVKATLGAAGLVFEAAEDINKGGAIDPDGPAVAITGSGLVVDASGWDQTPQAPPLSPCGDGDAEIYSSAAPDTGATSFATMAFTKRVIWCVPNRVDARYLYADGETLYHVYEDGGDEPDPSELIFQIRHADGTWTPSNGTTHDKPPAVFPDGTFQIENWTVRRIGDALHAVLRTSDGALHHAMLPLGGETWTPLAAPPSIGANGHGMMVAAYGIGMILVEFDGSGVPTYAFWDGATWSAWTPLAVFGAARDYLAGADGPRPALIWTQTGIGGLGIQGLVLP